MGSWLLKSLLLLRRLDSTKVSYWRLTVSTVTPVPKYTVPTLATGLATMTTSWRE